MNRQPNHAVHYRDDTVTLYTGDATDVLAGLPAGSVDCVVTSPPYWGLRDYGTGRWVDGDPACVHTLGRGFNIPQTKHPRPGDRDLATLRGADVCRFRRCGARREDRQYGLEPTPQDYIDQLRQVFAQLHRVLVDTGTVWLNLGDSYSAEPPGAARDPMRASTLSGKQAAAPLRESVRAARAGRAEALPRKNLYGMPWRTVFALQADGWILRNAIVWHKPNAMPESVRDRLSNRYETIFLLTKQQRYHFDLDSIREPLAKPDALQHRNVIGGSDKGRHGGIGASARRRGHTVYGKYQHDKPFTGKQPGTAMRPTGMRHSAGHARGKNPGDVWTLPTRPLKEAHFAAYPVDIPRRCIAAGCPEDGVVLDPFSGAATTGLAARALDRRYIGIDLNRDFHDIGLRRLGLTADDTGRAA